jgi:exodeoxyribonuclease VII small subunit
VEQLANNVSQKKPAADVGAMSFEAALGELETIVAKLEQGEVDLEDSITLYERGQALKTHCEAKLTAAEGRLEKLVLGAAGPVASELVETV